MPHIILEYAPTLECALNLPNLMPVLHQTLAAQETVDINRIKTRALPVQHVAVGAAPHPPEMVHLTIKILKGRPVELQKRIALALQAAVRAKLDAHPKAHVTVEITHLDPETYCA
jgi:5-carboxymethyl-2-hydroxymuconate isomerase